MGSGASGLGKSAAGASANTLLQNPLSTLQQTVAGAQSRDLMSVYDTLGNRTMTSLSNEEKMVRAVVIDELAERGNLIYDPKSGDYSKYSQPQDIVYNDGKSYRISSVEQRAVYNPSTNSYSDKDFAKAELFYNGKWAAVKNPNIEESLAVKYKQKKQRG